MEAMEDMIGDAPSGSGTGGTEESHGSTPSPKTPSSSSIFDRITSSPSSSNLLSGLGFSSGGDPTGDTLAAKVKDIAECMASFVKDTHSIVSKEEIESCEDIDVLKQKCTQLFKSREMMQIQLRIMDLQRTMEVEGSAKQQEELNAQADATRREEIYRQILVVLESEFSCSICSDIYIQPTVVGCGHTFCNFCIMQWKREKFDCPICRKWLREESKHVEMENFVNKMYTLFSSEVRERRQQLIRDRQEAIIQTAASRASAASAPPNPSAMPVVTGIAREDIEAWRTADRNYRSHMYARRAEMYESLRRRRLQLREAQQGGAGGSSVFQEPRGIDGDPEVIMSRRAAAAAAYIRRETENRAARRMRDLASAGASQSAGAGQSAGASQSSGAGQSGGTSQSGGAGQSGGASQSGGAGQSGGTSQPGGTTGGTSQSAGGGQPGATGQPGGASQPAVTGHSPTGCFRLLNPPVAGAPRTHRFFHVGPYDRLHRHPLHRHLTSGRITVLGRPPDASQTSGIGSSSGGSGATAARPSAIHFASDSSTTEGPRSSSGTADMYQTHTPSAYYGVAFPNSAASERAERRRTESDRRASILNSTARILESAENATNVDRAVARILRRQVANENTFIANATEDTTTTGGSGGGTGGATGSDSSASQLGGTQTGQRPPLILPGLPPNTPVSLFRSDVNLNVRPDRSHLHRVGIIVEDSASSTGERVVYADMEVIGMVGTPPVRQPEQPREGVAGGGGAPSAQDPQSDDVLFLGCRMFGQMGQYRHGASANQPASGASSSNSPGTVPAAPTVEDDHDDLNDILPGGLPTQNPSTDRTNPNDDSDLSSMDEDYDPLL